MKKQQAKTVEVTLDLGDLKPLVQKAAKHSGVSVNDFIVDALQSRVRQAQEEWGRGRENFTPHGGQHKYGRYSGYEVTDDGRYYPAPMWRQQFEQFQAERAAIVNLANSVVVAAQERLVAVEQSIFKVKNRLIDELGLDPNKNWVYYFSDGGYLVEEKEAERPAQPADS